MSNKEFWYGDTRLLKAYQLSYYRKVSYESWLQGQHDYVAFATVMANAFSKNSQKVEYPKWKDPMEKFAKPTPNRLENNEGHNNQLKWFSNMLQRK